MPEYIRCLKRPSLFEELECMAGSVYITGLFLTDANWRVFRENINRVQSFQNPGNSKE